MICSYCKGRGGEIDVILDDGTGPWEECGFCKGSGELSFWLKFKLWFLHKFIWK